MVWVTAVGDVSMSGGGVTGAGGRSAGERRAYPDVEARAAERE